jgi:ubiquinone biosynthesis protein
MLQTAVVAVRDRARLQEIVGVLLRFGLADLVDTLGLARFAPRGSHGSRSDPEHPLDASRPERLRMALEHLGPSFVKLGQIMATRSDLLSPEWTAALQQLHSNAAPLPWETAQPLIEQSLGLPVEQVFTHFDRVPLASASMAQVYRARLPVADGGDEDGGRQGEAGAAGTEVVVKVQRPGLRPQIEADLRLLEHLALLAQEQWPQLSRYRPREVTRQLAQALREELDFTVEAHNGDAVARHFADQPEIVVPGRLPELEAAGVPVLVVQGTTDPYGTPPATPTRTVTEVPGDHSLKKDPQAVAAALAAWLPTVLPVP